jgi:hypothetical protein
MAAIDVDTAAIRAAAGRLVPLGFDAFDQARAAVRDWRSAEPFYVAPEAPTLLAALDPVGPAVLRISERLSTVSRALIAYADTAEPLIAQIKALRAAPDSAAPGAAAARAAQLQRLMDELLAAEQACASAIEAVADDPGFTGVPAKTRVGEATDKASAVVKLGVIKIGANSAFTVTTFSDGSVMVTFVDARELGATLGVGGEFGVDEAGFGAKIEIEPGLTLTVGDTWLFEDTKAFADMREQLHEYGMRRQLAMTEDGALGVLVADTVRPLSLRPPDIVAAERALALQGTGKFGPQTPGAFDPSAKLTLGGTPKATVTHNAIDGTVTTTIASETSGALSAGLTGQRGPASGGFTGEGKGTLTTSAAVTRDTAGNVTRVILTETQEVAGKLEGTAGTVAPPDGAPVPTAKEKDSVTDAHLVTRTTTLQVGDRDRELVEQAIGEDGGNLGTVLSTPGTFYPDRVTPGEPFQQLLHTNATVTEVEYDKSVDQSGAEGELKAGLTVGAEASLESTDVHATRASYLDRPGADGIRRAVDFPEGVPAH